MPTPSEKQGAPREWVARTDTPRRSVFGNYTAARQSGDRQAHDTAPATPAFPPGLQSDIDVALSRSYIYRLLAKGYEYPEREGWQAWTNASAQASLLSAIEALGPADLELNESAARLMSEMNSADFEAFSAAFVSVFGHAARGRCPMNELEYGHLKADPLFQPHRLADLGGFYQAFGLELAPDADERMDHICLELEFMCVLAAKEAYALEHQLDAEERSLCREAQRKFLREHLGRWTPGFARHLARLSPEPLLTALAEFTRAWLQADCRRFGLPPGSDEMLLRPVDEPAESLCASCHLSALPPGAQAPAAETDS